MRYQNNSIQVVFDDWEDYELLDSGDRRRLERLGEYRIIRPEPRAWWARSLPDVDWQKADAIYEMQGEKGRWLFCHDIPQEWMLQFERLKLKVKLTNTSKHIGVFPEQSSHWQWIMTQVRKAKRPINVFNGFGYTGVATLAATSAGASVTHVDASKASITWAVENQVASNLTDKPIRWIVDDVAKFIKREIKRGKKYDALILDPPAFGRGPQGQVWKIDSDLPRLLDDCRQLLSKQPVFVVLTAYGIDSSALSLGNLLADTMKNYHGGVDAGEFVLKYGDPQKPLPLSIFARYSFEK